jgi:transposase
MEIITGIERRRRWRREEKLRIVAGASFAEVARRHEVSRGLLWNWRRQVRQGALVPEPMPMFTPVQITAEATPLERPSTPRPVSQQDKSMPMTEAGRIEIAFPDGTCIRVSDCKSAPSSNPCNVSRINRLARRLASGPHADSQIERLALEKMRGKARRYLRAVESVGG